MQKGRTFITNGPAIFIEVDEKVPGDTIRFKNDRKVNVRVTWRSHYPIKRVGIVHNGRVVKRRNLKDASYEGEWEAEFPVDSNGWIAVRCSGVARDSYNQSVFAHTSPVYLQNGKTNPNQKKDAAYFLKSIAQSEEWIQHTGRYTSDDQRNALMELFEKGKKAYQRLAKQ
jgi:signal peptidase I